MAAPTPTPEQLRAAFDAPAPLTVGLEEEVMLLHPESLDLQPRASDVLARLPEDGRFMPELPAAHLEIVVPPQSTVPDAIAVLGDGRRAVAAAAEGIARPAVAAVHPLTAPLGALSRGGRYDALRDQYAEVARAQLLCALQVHVAVGDADRALPVYNALRGHLPELAALAANAPFLAGRDTGLASVRPKISELLPRQGVPPALPSWEAFARELAWGARAGAFPDSGGWWWEVRPHPVHGTLEVRVPDAQTTVADAAAVAAVAHALVAWLCERHAAGEELGAPDSWRIAANRWSAARFGVDGTLADLATGEPAPTRRRLETLLDALAPVAARLGCARELERARALVEVNGALRQRAVAARAGVAALPAWLADEFIRGGASGAARQ